MRFTVKMNNHLPISCFTIKTSSNAYEGILDFFSMNNRSMYIHRDNTIISIWYKSGDDLLGYLSTRRSSNGTEIALTAKNTFQTLTQLNKHNITTGIAIQKSFKQFFTTNNTLILFANRYYVEVSQQLEKWIPLEVKNLSSLICATNLTLNTLSTSTPTPTSIPQSMSLYVYITIGCLILLILLILWISLCVYHYCLIRSYSSDEDIDRRDLKERLNSTPKTKSTNSKSKSEAKSKSRTIQSSQGFSTSSLRSDRAYNKTIPLSSGVDTLILTSDDIKSKSTNIKIGEKAKL